MACLISTMMLKDRWDVQQRLDDINRMAHSLVKVLAGDWLDIFAHKHKAGPVLPLLQSTAFSNPHKWLF